MSTEGYKANSTITRITYGIGVTKYAATYLKNILELNDAELARDEQYKVQSVLYRKQFDNLYDAVEWCKAMHRSSVTQVEELDLNEIPKTYVGDKHD